MLVKINSCDNLRYFGVLVIPTPNDFKAFHLLQRNYNCDRYAMVLEVGYYCAWGHSP